MGIEGFKKNIQAVNGLKILENEPMNRHTSFHIGGPALMIFPENQEALLSVIRAAACENTEPLIMGNGTNLLVTDSPLSAPVINTCGMCGIIRSGKTSITVQSGTSLARVALFAAENGLAGLEFAHGIPGTVGGGVYMNAGAYGGEIKDVAAGTAYADYSLEVKYLSGDEQDFSYRRSAFSGGKAILLSTIFNLHEGSPVEIKSRMAELMSKRKSSQPLELPSAGSTFKRPSGAYAAALIDQAGLRGYSSGGAAVSQKHAGFIVNRGGATFSDVMRVIEHVQSEVLRQFGVELEPEVKIIR